MFTSLVKNIFFPQILFHSEKSCKFATSNDKFTIYNVMTKEQRTAMARIISDMIKADNIIEESEIKDMKKLMSEYVITHQEMSDARKIRFTDAVNTLKELPIKERKSFFDHIYSIALSDNICVPREALLLIAFQYCLIEDYKNPNDGKPLPKPYYILSLKSDVYSYYIKEHT